MKPRKQHHHNPDRWLCRQWMPDLVQPSPKTILEMAREAREHHGCLFYLPTLDTNGFTSSHVLVFERPSPPPPPPHGHTLPEDTSATNNSFWLQEDDSVAYVQQDGHSDDIDDNAQDEYSEESNSHVFSMQITRISDSNRGIVHLARLDLTSFHIPLSTIPHLSHLISLRLQGNRLCTVPDAIFRLPCLRELDLSHNQISALSGLIALLAPTLQELFLQSNQLTSLPQQLGRLTRLKMLDIADNRLACVPVELKRLISDSVSGGASTTASNSGSSNPAHGNQHHQYHVNPSSMSSTPSSGIALGSSIAAVAAPVSNSGRFATSTPRRLPSRRGTTGSSNSSSSSSSSSFRHGGIQQHGNIGHESNGLAGAVDTGDRRGGDAVDQGFGATCLTSGENSGLEQGESDQGGQVQRQEEQVEEEEEEEEEEEGTIHSETDSLDIADDSGEGGHHDDDYVQIRPGIKCWTRGNRFWQVDHHESDSSRQSQQAGHRGIAIAPSTSGLEGAGGIGFSPQAVQDSNSSSSSSGGESGSLPFQIPSASDTLASTSSLSGMTRSGGGGGGGASLFHEAAHARKDSYTSSLWTLSLSDLCSQVAGECLYRDPHIYCTAETCPEKWRRRQQQRQRGWHIQNRGQRRRQLGKVPDNAILEEEEDEDEDEEDEGEGMSQQQRQHQRWLAKGKMKAGEDIGADLASQTQDEQSLNPILGPGVRQPGTEDLLVEDDEDDAGPTNYEQCVVMLLPEWTIERLGLYKIAELRKSLAAHDQKLRRQRREGLGGEHDADSSEEEEDDDDDDACGRRRRTMALTSGLPHTTPRHQQRILFHQQWAPIPWTAEEQEQARDRCSVCGQRLFFDGMVWKRVGVLGERVVPLELVSCSVSCRARAEQEERLRRREAHMRNRRQKESQQHQQQQQQQHHQQQHPGVGSIGTSTSTSYPRRTRASTHTASSTSSMIAGGSGASGSSNSGSRMSSSSSSSQQVNQTEDAATSPIAPTPALKSPTPIPLSRLQGISLPDTTTNVGDGDVLLSPTGLNGQPMPSNSSSVGGAGAGGSGTARRDSTTSSSSYSQGVEQPRASSPWPSQDLLHSQPQSQADSPRNTPMTASLGWASGDTVTRDGVSWSSSSAVGGGNGTVRGREHFTVSPMPKTSLSSNSTPAPRGEPLPSCANGVYSQQPQQQQVPGDGLSEQGQSNESSVFSRFPPPLPPLVPPMTFPSAAAYEPIRPYENVHHSRLFRNECLYLCLVRQNPRTRSYSI